MPRVAAAAARRSRHPFRRPAGAAPPERFSAKSGLLLRAGTAVEIEVPADWADRAGRRLAPASDPPGKSTREVRPAGGRQTGQK